MLTRRQYQAPVLTGDAARDVAELSSHIARWFGGLNQKDALGIAPRWTWTPTLSASSGTLTSASAAAVATRIEHIVFFTVGITITTNGTAAGILRFTLPTTPNVSANFCGKEIGITNDSVTGQVTSGSAVVDVVFYTGAYPGADGATVSLSGFYFD